MTEQSPPAAPPQSQQLDIKKTWDQLRSQYQDNERSQSYNAIIYGDIGTGKTSVLGTARAPILVHSFDPGGAKVLRREIESGRVAVDQRFESEPKAASPRAWRLWESEYERLKRMRIFDQLGTFSIDSLTTMTEAMMNAILSTGVKVEVVAGQKVPSMQAYMALGLLLRDVFKDLSELPCDVIVTAHMEAEKDELSGAVMSSIMVTGKMKIKLPMLFDEVYVATTTQGVAKDGKTNESQYWLQTQNNGIYKARTRLGGGGVFAEREPANIKALLKKAGYPCEDKAGF